MQRRAHRRQAGFTYVGMVVFVTIIGLVGAATLKVGALLQRAEAENELLAIGAEFSAALASYAAATPAGQPAQPASLEALLRDPRFPNPRRHLRRIPIDPVTGRTEWGLVRAAEGGPILGVHSLSQAQPLKVANFDARFVNFEHKRHLSEWRFVANGQGLAANGAAPGQGVPVEVTMFPPPPEPDAPVAAPVEAQAVLRELEPPPEPPKPDEEEEKEEEKDEETPPPEPGPGATRSGF